MSDESGVDPRFPAVFQRGYEGGGAVQPPVKQPIGLPPAVEERATPSGATATESATLEAETSASPAEPEERNPFITAVWVASIALTLSGLVVVYWANSSLNYGWSGNDIPFEVVIRQFAYMAAPPAITAGLLGILGLLFWHAAAWRRRAMAAHRHPEH